MLNDNVKDCILRLNKSRVIYSQIVAEVTNIADG